jgi:hypothetical protein
MFPVTSILIYCESTVQKTCMNIQYGETPFCKFEYLSLLGDSISFVKQIWNSRIRVQRHMLYLEWNLDATVSLTKDCREALVLSVGRVAQSV